jgi:hypothetical protein
MSNKNQTPVEWLYLELFYFLNGQSKFEDAEKILERAKEMEKEQLEEAELRGKEIIIIKQTEHKGGNE